MKRSWEKRAPSLAWLCFILWAGLSFSTLATTTDLWVHFKVGEDILAGLGWPTLEQYSVPAQGRTFVAYEWLSAVVFAEIHRLFGFPGLLVLRQAVGLGCLGFLFFSLEPRVRRQPVVLPLLLLVDYLICFRTHLRPHLFSLVMISALCFAIEHWRRSRRLSDIAWLIPMHGLWANLHGAYLFGVVVLGVVTGFAALSALIGPRISAGERPYSRRDVVQIGAVALASFAICGLNPYGTAILELSFRMSEASEFIKNEVWEWKSPFQVGPGSLWFAIYCILLALLSISVLMRILERRWLDCLLAALVIYQSMRANRFVSHLALVGFPIIARCASDISDRFADRKVRSVRPWLEFGLIAFMLATAIGPLSSYSPRQFRTLGWGFSPRFPIEEMEYIRDHDLEGTIFNEYGDGSLVIYFLHPDVRPVMDPRIDIYGPELYDEWKNARHSPDEFFAYVQKYDIRLVLLKRIPVRKGLIDTLIDHPSWSREKLFKRRVLFVKRKAPRGADRVVAVEASATEGAFAPKAERTREANRARSAEP